MLIGQVLPPYPTPLRPRKLPEERERAIDRFVKQFVDLAMFDGTILIDHRGEVVYEKSFGYANYELSVTHNANSRP